MSDLAGTLCEATHIPVSDTSIPSESRASSTLAENPNIRVPSPGGEIRHRSVSEMWGLGCDQDPRDASQDYIDPDDLNDIRRMVSEDDDEFYEKEETSFVKGS